MNEISMPESVAMSVPAGERGTAGAILARVRAHALLQTAWMERLWSEGQTSPDQGLAITPVEVKRILSHPDLRAERFDRFLVESASHALLNATLAADEALAADPFWKHLVELFDLSIPELDLLCLLTAVEIDPALGRVFAYLADDTRATDPTLLLATTLFRETAEALPADLALPNILRWRLAHPLTGAPAWRVSTAWQADEALVRSIREERWLDPALEPWCTIIESAAVEALPILYPNLLAQLQQQMAIRMNAQEHQGGDAPSELALAGAEGSGRQTLAAQLSASFGRPMLVVSTPALLAGPRTTSVSNPIDDLIRAVRLAHARQALLYWRGSDAISSTDWTDLRSLARVLVAGVRSIPSTATWGVTLPPLPTAKRFELWRHLTEAPIPSIVRTQRLSPAEIRLCAAAPDPAAIHAALAHSVPRSSDLLNILPCPYTWDDLVVAPDLSQTLHDFESQVRLRWEVYEEWGFSRLTHLGQGISALFGGPSGTGKTMAAQVLARSLDLTLYRVDLAGVVNKYIGETEKRLRDVFDACERSSGLLFFDEADALFGSRFQSREAHDRFANIEIDYLLQRIEQFDGIAILATNRKNDIDTAFLRRLRFVCDFLPPGKPERLDLWRKALPASSPAGEEILGDIDFQGLADNIDLNGAQIKAIALGAAFIARSEGTNINMKHIELAASREFGKQGLRLRQPFAKPPRI
jgi:ATPase family associated with various cellular activities (AAA)